MNLLDTIGSYRIVYADDEYAECRQQTAAVLAEGVRELTGAALPVQSDEEPECGREILIGPVCRAAALRLYDREPPAWMHYCVRAEGEKILLAGSTPFTDLRACDCFLAGLRAGRPVTEAQGSLLPERFPAHSGELRAMTFNLLVEYAGWGAGGVLRGPVPFRMEPVVGLIRGYRPDILCCQEAFERWSMTLPHLLGREYGCILRERPDGYSNRTFLLYRKASVRVLESGYEDIPIIKTVNKRVVVWALLELRTSGRRVLVCGTHWECTTDADRAQQAELMAALALRLQRQYGAECISLGDFNCLPESGAYAGYLKASGHADCEGEGGCHWSVDHIFHSAGLVPHAFGRESGEASKFASDHQPLYCDFTFA